MVKKRKAVGTPDWAAIEDDLRDQCAVYSVEYRKPSPNEKSTARENRHRKLKDLYRASRASPLRSALGLACAWRCRPTCASS